MRGLRSVKWKVIAISIGLLSVQQSQAAVNLTGLSIMGEGGLGLITSTASNTGFAWGAEVDYRIGPNLEVGAQFITQSLSSFTSGFTTISTGFSLVTANLNYHLSGDLSPLYFGLKLGLGLSSVSTSIFGLSTTNTTTSFSVGAQTGYHFKIGNNVKLGPQIQFVYVASSPTLTVLDFLAAVGYEF